MRLFAVPRTSARRAKPPHDRDKIVIAVARTLVERRGLHVQNRAGKQRAAAVEIRKRERAERIVPVRLERGERHRPILRIKFGKRELHFACNDRAVKLLHTKRHVRIDALRQRARREHRGVLYRRKRRFRIGHAREHVHAEAVLFRGGFDRRKLCKAAVARHRINAVFTGRKPCGDRFVQRVEVLRRLIEIVHRNERKTGFENRSCRGMLGGLQIQLSCMRNSVPRVARQRFRRGKRSDRNGFHIISLQSGRAFFRPEYRRVLPS